MAKLFVLLSRVGFKNSAMAGLERGDLAKVEESSYVPSGIERIPNFGVYDVPSVTLAQAEAYLEPWNLDVTITVVDTDTVQDIVTADLNFTGNTDALADSEGKIKSTLKDWNLGLSRNGNAVRVVADIGAVAASDGFWKTPSFDSLVFTDLGYDEPSGEHTLEMDYTLVPIEDIFVEGTDANGEPTFELETLANRKLAIEAKVATIVADHGATVISNTWPTCTFKIVRTEVTSRLVTAVKSLLNLVKSKRRYYFDDAALTTLILNDGIQTLTSQEAVNLIKDKELD